MLLLLKAMAYRTFPKTVVFENIFAMIHPGSENALQISQNTLLKPVSEKCTIAMSFEKIE